MAMRYGTDDVEAGRRRRRAGQVPARQVEGTYRVDPRGNVTPPKELAPQQPRAAARQTVNQETVDPSSRGRFASAFQRFLDTYATMQDDARAARMQSPMAQVGQIGGKVPSTRPQATPIPFSQQLVQSGMMNTQPIWDYSSGQGVRAPGYSVNPMHPMWQSSSIPQFRTGQSPMDYYGGDTFRGSMPYRMPQMPGAVQGMWDVGSGGGQIPQQTTPRVWRGSEMTPEGFRGIMNQYGANIPWKQQMQSMPYPVPMMPFGF